MSPIWPVSARLVRVLCKLAPFSDANCSVKRGVQIMYVRRDVVAIGGACAAEHI